MLKFLRRLFSAPAAPPSTVRWARPWDGRKDVAGLMAAVSRGAGTWAAKQHGECCTCGHEWRPGEIIGCVTQAYVRTGMGTVQRNPAVRLACAVCVERQRVQGDLSLQWAREAGVL